MIHGTQTTKDHLAGYPSPLVFEVGTDPSSSGRNHSWGEKTELLAAQALPVLWLQMWMENSLYLSKPFKHTSHTNLKNCGSSKTARKLYGGEYNLSAETLTQNLWIEFLYFLWQRCHVKQPSCRYYDILCIEVCVICFTWGYFSKTFSAQNLSAIIKELERGYGGFLF